MVTDNTMLRAALEYAAKGIPVFPLHNIVDGHCSCGNPDCFNKGKQGKHPRTGHGLSDATTDKQQIYEWWSKWPDANIGGVTGKKSGLVVVDVDPRHGGDRTWSDLQDRYGAVNTLTVMTGGGGNHYIFETPESIPLKSNTGENSIGEGIDLRAEGGYIVLPPSNHISGNDYEWENQDKPSPIPGWLLDRWPVHQARSSSGASGNGTRSNNDDHDPWVCNLLFSGSREGSRNNDSVRLAGYFHSKGIPADIIAKVMEPFRLACVPPMPLDEMLATIGSAQRYPNQDDDWGDLRELETVTSVPSLPASMVPGPFRDWLVGSSERACIPLEMFVAPAVTAAGSLIGRRVGIQPSPYNKFVTATNFWGAIVAPPASLKSAVQEEGMSPLKQLAAIARERHQAALALDSSAVIRVKAEIDGIKSQITAVAKGSNKSGSIADLEQKLTGKLREQQDLDTALVERRYMTQDSTTEKLGELLRQNPNGLLVLRDELAGFFRTMDKPGREGDREFYLEGWNGTGDYSQDRIGRGTIHIPSMCVSIFGGIQPGKLERYIRDAIDGGAGDDGLLQRIQLFVWPDSLGPWIAPTAKMDDTPRTKAFTIFSELDKKSAQELGADCDGEGIPALRFSRDAQELFDQWRDELEHRCRSKELEKTPAFAAHIGKYRSLMPSLALVFHLLDMVANGQAPSPVGLPATKLADQRCVFLELHARKIYPHELSPGISSAHTLGQKIQSGEVHHGDSVRSIYAPHHWAELSTAGEVTAALEILESFGWVRIETVFTDGRPSDRVLIHPGLRGL